MKKQTAQQFYKHYTWPDDPESDLGKKYFERAQAEIGSLCNSEYLQTIINKDKEIKILELMAGVGYGGVALAQELDKLKISYELHLTDIRSDVLKTAETFTKSVKGKPYVYECDIRDISKLQWQFDIVLIYGLSLPHLNPWEWIQFCQAMPHNVNDAGALIVHETDRRLFDFIQKPYQKIAYAGKRNGADIIHMHEGYNIFKGTIKRKYIEVGNSQTISNELYYWGLAEAGAMMSVGFSKIAYQHIGNYRYFITGQFPKKNV